MKIKYYIHILLISCFISCIDSTKTEDNSKVVENGNGQNNNGDDDKTPQSPIAYYKNINFKLRGNALKQELSKLIIDTHTQQLSYGDIWNVLKVSDLDPKDTSKVLLLYGSESNNGKYARARSKNANGGGNGDWNREHTYAKSLGKPNLKTFEANADAHHLRASDVQLNSDRGNLKFDDGSGAKAYKTNRGGWYPGNEWKGDVARMMMYMYVRYGERCAATGVGMNPYTYSSDFPDVFIKWNIEDSVSDFEKQRNTVIYKAQGNRNPFIDNPYLATLIWGGPKAQNTWSSTFSN